MAENTTKIKGPLKSDTPAAGGATSKPYPIIGTVKNNIDPLRMGRMQVYLDYGTGTDPDDATQWRTVRWAMPYYGVTRPQASDDNWGDFVANPTSYGMWYSPPDIGTKVICIFIQGKDDYGYVIAAIPDPETLHMIPAIGASDNVVLNGGEASSYGGATRLPVTNLNIQNTGLSEGLNFLNEAKPVHSYSAMAMHQQGILRDPVRGAIGCSANRESPSRVGFGVSTPGRPIYEGGYDDAAIASAANPDTPPENLRVIARRGGHSFIMDDGDIIGRDCVIRLRTALGHQILMSDDGQVISILASNGQAYIELGKEGTVDIFATNSINLRTQGDLNFHADRNINFHAVEDINMKTGKNLNIDTEKKFSHRIGKDSQVSTGGKHTHKVSNACSFESGGDISLASVAIAYVNGSKVNLNSGATSTIPLEVDPIPLLAHTDTLWDQSVGWAAVPGYLLSVANRVPAHYPWANAGQGVDAKVDSDAASNLPAAPTSAASAVNQAAGLDPPIPTSVAAGAAMPAVGGASAALDQNTTSNMLGGVATTVANGPAAAATQTGSAIVDGTAFIGQFGQTPEQMELGGYLKPGSSTLVNSLVESGSNAFASMTNNLFTGKDGVNSLQQFIDNIDTQASSMVKNFQASQNYFTAAGVMTGKEHPTQIAGIIQAGVTQGLENTLNTVINGSGAAATLKEIASGNFAATLAENVTSGKASISAALNLAQQPPSLESLSATAKGIAASAFAQITAGFKPFEAGVPQNLKEIAKQARESVQGIDIGDALVGAATSSLSSAIATGVNNLIGGQSTVNNIVNQSQSAINDLASDVNNLINSNNDLSGNQLNNLNNLSDSLDSAVGSLNNTLNNLGSSLMDEASNLLNNAIETELNEQFNNLVDSISGGISSGLSQLGLSNSAATELMSAISALGSGGSASIKLPSVGTNTFNRAGLTAAISNVLGNPKIPMPNFAGEVAGAAVSAAEGLIENLKSKIDENQQKSDKVFSIEEAEAAFNEAERNYPPGDPRIVAAYQAYVDAVYASL